MRVGLQAMYLDPGRSGGSETYLRGLVPALAEHDIELEIATTRRGARALEHDGFDKFARIHTLPADEGERLARLRAEQLLVPKLARARGWDLIHSLANTGPLRSPVPHVLSLLDVIFFQHQTLSLVSTIGLRPLVRRVARRARSIITISEAAREDIATTLGIERERIVVTPLAAGPPRAEPSPEDGVRERLGLDGKRVVLSVGAIRPHKNQQLLVRAIERMPEHVLVLAGDPEADLGVPVTDQVRLTGYVPDADLEALWQMADCAAFATLAEGFGLPVLEAMRRGVAVACSDLPVLREVGGDIPHYFDPHDPDAAAAAMRAAASDDGARAAGPERAAQFSWEETARLTADAYACAVR